MIYKESNVRKIILNKNKSMYKSFAKVKKKYRLWLSSNRTKTQSVEQVSLTFAKS